MVFWYSGWWNTATVLEYDLILPLHSLGTLVPEVDFMKREITAAFVSQGMHTTESRLLD